MADGLDMLQVADAPRNWHDVFPLIVLNDPVDSVWEHQPTYLIIELSFLVLAAWGIYDASMRPRGVCVRACMRACLLRAHRSERVGAGR